VRRKKKVEEQEDRWAYYKSIQLTPEQRAELRAELEKDVERARAEGVYERLIAMRGKVKFNLSPWWGKR
jgi:hypothetical protein